MFLEIILPIFRSTRLCVTACGIMYPRCCRTVAVRQHHGYIIPQTVTHSLVLLRMGKIIVRNTLSWLDFNKPLLLHLFGCLYYLYEWCTVKQISDNEIYLLIKYIKNVLWRIAKNLSYIEDARCLNDNSLLVNWHTDPVVPTTQRYTTLL